MREEIIGDCRLILGDCRDVLPTLTGIDAMVTDPPYGVELKRRVTKHTTRAATETYADDAAFIETEVLPRVRLALTITPVAALTPGNRWLHTYPQSVDVGTVFFSNGAGRSPWGFNCNNPILFYGSCPYLKKGMGSRPNSVSATHWFSDDVDHPCPKPVQMMEWLVNRVTTERDTTILDPFMGSGTTGIACVNLGRYFVGIEVNSAYFDLACRRIEACYKEDSLLDPRRSKHFHSRSKKMANPSTDLLA